MRVILGSNGFIGRHLTIEAARRGLDLTLVSPTFDREFLAAHAPHAATLPASEFTSAAGDRIAERASAIVYLASRSVPGSSMQRPAGELGENVEPAFSTFLRISAVNPEVLIVYLSSGGTVYGRTAAAEIAEDHPLRPISPYGLGKQLSEECLRFCGETRGQRYAILRVSNPVGRWHRNVQQGLVPAVFRAIRSGAPLRIFGDGTSVRDYLDADDLADAILSVAGTQHRDRIWNIGSGVGYTTLEVVELVAEIAGRRPEIEFVPPRGIDVERCVLSAKRIRDDLGWQAETPLAESVRKVSVDIK